MRVLLVMNKPNREISSMESIKRAVHCISPSTTVEIRHMYSPDFNRFVFSYKPNVILTFPFTAKGLNRQYYLYKVFIGAKIITLRTEGVVDFNNEHNIQWALGFDRYGDCLVDFELFWGGRLAQEIGGRLVQQKKLSSTSRVKVVGFPRIESYLENNSHASNFLPLRIRQKLAAYNKKDIFLFITGFHLANYTRQNLFDARDLDAENKLDELLKGVEISKNFRSDWVKNIIAAAADNQHVLLIVKKHPIEKKDDYIDFDGVNNILFIYEDICIAEIIPSVGYFLHYGSTALVDAYLLKIPSIYVYSKQNKQWYSDLGWPSSLKIEVNEIPLIVKDILAGTTNFDMNCADIKCVLKDVFHVEEGNDYKPSHEIAKIILDPTPPQKIQLTDIYFLKALINTIWLHTYCFISNLPRKFQLVVQNFTK
jgi:surface carbohydrate biosynthesis protein